MATLTKKITLVFADAGTADGVQHNKVWYGELYDTGDVITRWGRVGYDLQSKDFPGAGEGFLLKKQSEKLKKGYTEAKVIDAACPASSAKPIAVSNLHEIAKSQLLKSSSPILDKLIDRLVKSNVHKITSSTNITFNDISGLFSTPIGVVTPDAVNEARQVLVGILPLVKNQNYGEKLNGLTGQYLRLIPQNIGMKFNVRNIFPDETSVQKQEDILQSLEASYQALTSTPKKVDNKSSTKEEEIFKVDLDVLKDNSEIDRISKWFYNSNHSTHGYGRVKIINFLKVKIVDNWNNFNERLGNLKEVWHGTGEGNLLSILKSGVRVSPPSTTYLTGKMFGPGHYGALDSSKSMQYTFGRFGGNSGPSGWLFVMDFALGNTFLIRSYGGNVQRGYDSIWAKKENTGLRFDELIVPKDSQVRIKYLLEIK